MFLYSPAVSGIPDVAQVGGAEQGIAKGVYQHVGIGVSEQAEGMVYAYAAQPKFTVFHQPVDIESESYSCLHDYRRRPTKSLIPSMSNDNEKRRVWSRGLVCAIATI